MKVLSVAHLKGGVGKTTTAVNLAFLAAEQGISTLLVDMDAQAAASYLFRLDSKVGARAKKVVAAKKSLTDEILASDYLGLDILPASLSFRKLPVLLAEGKGDKEQVGVMLKRVGRRYDLVVVDAPAGLTLESEEIVRASDLLLIPIVPSPLGVGSYEKFRTFVRSHSKKTRVRAFLSMVDRRRTLHREMSETLQADAKQVWPIEIPYSSAVERMTTERSPLSRIKRPGRSLAAFRGLWGHCREELDLGGADDRA